MKINCEIVQDLLPLYEDGVCSESSRAAVEKHLQTCENCRSFKEGAAAVPEQEITLEPTEEERKVAGSFRKVRRRWGISLIAIFLAVPLLMMIVNQFRGAGPCATNLDDIWTAKRFVAYLQKGEYERAANMHEFSTMYQDILSSLARAPEEYARQFEKIQIDGETWYMDVDFVDQFRYETESMSIWHSLIYNRYYGVLIPEDALLAVVEAEEGILTRLNDDIYDCVNGQCFRLLETPWGNFFTDEGNILGWNLLDRKLTDYGNRFTVMPEAMYQEVSAAMTAEADRAYRTVQADYAAVGEMTEKEFRDHMREKYAAELAEAFADVTLTGGSLSGAYRAGERWQMQLKVRAASGAQANDLEIVLLTDGGAVSDVTCSYAWSIEYSWLRNLMDALHISYLD